MYGEIEAKRVALEKELTDVNRRLEELQVEEEERIRLLKERDVVIDRIAKKHHRLNEELMRKSSQNRVGESGGGGVEGELLVAQTHHAVGELEHGNEA